MLIDEKIQELSERKAKAILRKAVENIEGRQSCGTCVMQIVCGDKASTDECMCKTLSMLSVLDNDEGGETEEGTNGGVVYFDPETMEVAD